MSRILARSVTADLFSRFCNLLLFLILLPFILISAGRLPSVRDNGHPRLMPAMAGRKPQGDLKPGP